MENRTLCVATYNIWHGDFVLNDVGIFGRELSRLGADIAGLQEVDIKTSRVGGMDTLAVIADAGGYAHYAFTRAMDFSGGEYGTAILSRYPILSFEVIPLSSEGCEPRSVGHAVIEIGDAKIHFLNTHLSVEKKEMRRIQLEELRALIADLENVLLTGDFNTEELEDLLVLSPLETVNPRLLASYYPSEIAIDHIFYSNGFSPYDVQMPKLPYSDHYPITAHFRFDKIQKNT